MSKETENKKKLLLTENKKKLLLDDLENIIEIGLPSERAKINREINSAKKDVLRALLINDKSALLPFDNIITHAETLINMAKLGKEYCQIISK